jgi:3-oxoacyl-[acyl-carrier-protein] synthase II
MNRVVVTGVGLASPIGNDWESVVAALRKCESGISAQSAWTEVGGLRSLIGGAVAGVEFEDFERRRIRTMGRVALLSAFASERAVENSGLAQEVLQGGRCGLTYGSTHGSSSVFEDYCRKLFTKNSFAGIMGSHFLKFMSHTCAANLGEFLGIRGRVQPTCSACTSGSQAIGVAYEWVAHGLQDVMICGGAEELHYTHAGVFDVMFAASTRYNETPELTPRPFDTARDGVVTGEGAGTLVLERLDHALARGATIYAEVLGYGTNCDGIHLTAPSAEGMAACMRLGLECAGIGPDEVDYINAHGTGTEQGDIAESRATFEVFGDQTPVSTQKGQVGHTLGASGALESIFSIMMMNEGFIAANRNLEAVDPRCAPVHYVRGQAMERKIRTAVSNNFAFGGINTSLVYRRYDAL